MACSLEPKFEATIGYVRSLNIRRVAVWCNGKRAGGWQCHHDATLAIDAPPDDLPLLAIARWLRGRVGQT